MLALGALNRYKIATGKNPGSGERLEAVYARLEHGSHLVTPLKNSSFRVSWPQGDRDYSSARQTIIALVNRTQTPTADARDPHLTFDRYFRRGKFSRGVPAYPIGILDLFGPKATLAVAVKANRICPSRSLTVHQPEHKVGFDLGERAIEVRKLFYAGFARRVFRKGYDPEDVLQDVYTGLLARNNGICPFDSRKSSFSHYIHMVCGCILSNYTRRYSRLSRNEVFGVLTTVDGEAVMQDVAAADICVEAPPQENSLEHARNSLVLFVEQEAAVQGVDSELAVRCVDFLYEGRKNKEIVEITKSSDIAVAKMLRFVRGAAGEWRDKNWGKAL